MLDVEIFKAGNLVICSAVVNNTGVYDAYVSLSINRME